MPSRIYSAGEFWDVFIADLRQARARVLIQSPFLGANRLRLLAKEFRALAVKGVSICVFVQRPRYWGADLNSLGTEETYRLRAFKSEVEWLESMDIHVNLRPLIHGKLAVIDEGVAWEGSLNVLSHLNTEEQMRRWEDKDVLQELVKKYALERCALCKAMQLKLGIADAYSERLIGMGKMLAVYRTHLNMSQRQVARLSGLSHNRIWQIESGRNIRVDTLLQLSDALELEPAMLPRVILPAVMRIAYRLMLKMCPVNGACDCRIAKYGKSR